MRSHSLSRFLTLDALRGAAALVVAIYHFSPSWAGYLAVDFFFVLSGFVLSHTYLYRKTPLTFREFTLRRLARLYPLHIFTLLIFMLVWIGIHGQMPIQPDGTLFTFFQQLTFTQNIGLNPSGLSWNYPSWSISVEFWVNIAFILFVVRTTRSSAIFLIAATGMMVIYWNTGHLETQAANYFSYLNSGLLRGLSGFLLGVLSYRFYLRFGEDNFWKRLTIYIEPLSLVGLSIVVFSRTGKTSSYDFIAPFIFMLIVTSFAGETGLISRYISRFHYLGSISYSIYLNQIIVLLLVNHFMPKQESPMLVRLAVFLSLLIVTSHFTLTYVENPLRSLGKKLSTGIGRQSS